MSNKRISNKYGCVPLRPGGVGCGLRSSNEAHRASFAADAQCAAHTRPPLHLTRVSRKAQFPVRCVSVLFHFALGKDDFSIALSFGIVFAHYKRN